VVAGRPETVGELRFAVRHEGARTVADLLDRRTRVGLVPADRERAVAAAEAVLAEEL
jgi:glycerol-3-phosphate dehydrogenase